MCVNWLVYCASVYESVVEKKWSRWLLMIAVHQTTQRQPGEWLLCVCVTGNRRHISFGRPQTRRSILAEKFRGFSRILEKEHAHTGHTAAQKKVILVCGSLSCSCKWHRPCSSG